MGTYVNKTKIEPNNLFGLNCGDLIGMGWPEESSGGRDIGKETFVYRLKSPQAFHSEGVQVEGVEFEEDAPTPPPSPLNFAAQGAGQPLPDVVSGVGVPKAGELDHDVIVEDGVSNHFVQNAPEGVVKSENVEEVNSPANITIKNSEGENTSSTALVVDKTLVKRKRRIRHLLSSSEDDDEEVTKIKKGAKVPHLIPPTLRIPIFKSVNCSIESMRVPERAVAVHLEPENDKVSKWVVVPPKQYKKMARRWAGLKEDGSEGTPLFVELEHWNNDGNLSDISSNEDMHADEVPGASPISSEEEDPLVEATMKIQKDRIAGQKTEIQKSLKLVSQQKIPITGKVSRLEKPEPCSNQKEQPLTTFCSRNKEISSEMPRKPPTPEETAAKWKSSFGVVEFSKKAGGGREASQPTNLLRQVPQTLPLIKQEPGVTSIPQTYINYSQNEEVIEILDSSDEENYEANQSQSVVSPIKTNIDEELSDIEDLLRDSPSPTFVGEDESEMSDVINDDDDIEILKESQNSLYTTIFKAVHKVEPELNRRDESAFDSTKLDCESKLDEREDEDELIKDIVDAVEGADDNMVRSAIRKLNLSNSKCERVYDAIFDMVKEEVEDNMVRKLSKIHKCSVRQVKICLANLKGDDKDKHITEEMLKTEVEQKIKEEELVKHIECELKYPREKIQETINSMRIVKDTVEKDDLVARLREKDNLNECILSLAKKEDIEESIAREAVVEVMKNRGSYIEKAVLDLIAEKKCFNLKVDSIRGDLGCSEELVRDVLTLSNGDSESAASELRSRLLIHEKSKNLAEKFHTTVQYAKEKLEESELDEVAASQAIQLEQEEQESRHWAETFDISIEEAGQLYKDSGKDLVKASQILLDQMDDEEKKDKQEKDEIMEIDSPVDDDSDLKEQLKDSTGDKESSVRATTKEDMPLNSNETTKEYQDSTIITKKPSISSKINFSKEFPVPEGQITRTGPKLIEPMPMPHRKAFNRGISATTIESLSSKKIPKKVKEGHDNESKYSVLEKSKQKSKKEFLSERRSQLKNIAARLNDQSTIIEKLDTTPVGRMKISVPKNQMLLHELKRTYQSKKKLGHGNIERLKTGVGKERKLSGEDNGSGKNTATIGVRRASAGFLEEESNRDNIKKKEKYSATSDGYKSVNKMSLANIDYNTLSQDTSNSYVNAKPLMFAGIEAKKSLKTKNKRLQWRDHTGMEPLVDVKEIPSDNKGRKCGTGNKELFIVDLKEYNNEVGMNDVFKTILDWKCVWLEEQKKSDKCPPVEGNRQVLPLSEKFSSCEDYIKIMMPLMLNDLWGYVSKDYDAKVKSGRKEVIPVCVQDVGKDSTQQFNLVRCAALLTDQEARRDLGVDGTLVQLNIGFSKGEICQTGKQAREIKPCYGYVQQVKKIIYRGIEELQEIEKERATKLELAAEKTNRNEYLRYLVHYTVKIKANLASPDKVLAMDKPIYMKVLSRIKPELRKFQALLSVPMSKLQESLIQPTGKDFHIEQGGEFLNDHIRNVPQLSDNLNLNQRRSLVSIARTCMSESDTPKVCLLDGPPGSGKSSMIVGLILQLLYTGVDGGNKKTMPRILVVAPSNAAVDELVLKLVAVKDTLPDNTRFGILRLGIEKLMSNEVVAYSFNSNVKKMMTMGARLKKPSDTLEQDQRTKQEAANKLFEEKNVAEIAGNINLANKLLQDWKEKMQEINKIKEELKRPLESKEERELRKNAEDTTMAEADVIFTTLSSSLSKEMEKYFLQGVGTIRPISVCIMDDASQCLEPEALIPLKLGFSKLVMVGDHKQAPCTVFSTRARENGYQQSLFGRLVTCLTEESTTNMYESPVIRLDTQYRMHQEIVAWPSR